MNDGTNPADKPAAAADQFIDDANTIARREAKFAAITKEVHDIIQHHQLNMEDAMQVLGRGLIMLCLTNHRGNVSAAAEQCEKIGQVMAEMLRDPATEIIHHHND